MSQKFTPDPMTPEWSRDLAVVGSSPYFRGEAGWKRWDAFLEQAEQYATYDDLPPELKAIYDKARAAGEQHR